MQLSGSSARLMIAGLLARLVFPQKISAESRVAARFENYHEEHGRIEVQTFGLFMVTALRPSLKARGEFVYDVISGATPTGGPPLPGSDQVPLAHMSDIRRAGVFELNPRWGRHAVSPQIAYSAESDYESLGLALNYSVELNQKNTTLLAGFARTFDRVLPGHSFLTQTREKDALDLMLGVTQLLGPRTVLNANFTLGFADGYLSDPYKGVRFEGYPFFETLFPEQRPEQRDRQVGFLSLTHFLPPANAGFEASYRVSNDSFGILSHAAAFEWNQKLGRFFVLTPFVRYYTQSAADFYAASFPGDPSLSLEDVPEHYSSDYRLSRLDSWTYGMKLLFRFEDRLAIDVGYRRYDMRGYDGVTSASAYPSANIFTVGVSAWF